MLFASQAAEVIVADLRAMGFSQLLDVPAVPAANPCGMRYDVKVSVLPDRTDWYLRSFGVQFDLGTRHLRRRGQRWFSIGWGLAGSASRDEVPELLLVEAWQLPDAKVAGDLTPLLETASQYASVLAEGDCLRAAAVIGRARPGDVDGSGNG